MDLSIHPRNWKPSILGREKQNTCAPMRTGKKLKALKRLEARRHARDLSCENAKRHANKNIDWELCWKKPGSMKP
jgi:hypothetical protein